MKFRKILTLVFLTNLLFMAADALSETNRKIAMSVATWNVEHLAAVNGTGCKARNAEQMSALQDYARSIDADVVALQEVGSKEAVELLFPAAHWQVIMSTRPDNDPFECRRSGNPSTQQKIAFAVRKPIKVLDVNPVEGLGLEMVGLRYGLAIRVATPLGETDILNVHMKSGCFVDDYSQSDRESCQIFANQVPVLLDWVKQKEQSGKPYIMTGDFNHRLSAPYNRLTRDLKAAAPELKVATRDLLNCHPRYPAPIDHILMRGAGSQPSLQVRNHYFDDMDEEDMLSDHCAMSLTFQQ